MGNIRLPEEYTEISYEYGESYGSGSDQLEVLKWVGIGIGSVAVAGSIFLSVHRVIQGYWIWDREAANNMYRKAEVYYKRQARRLRRQGRFNEAETALGRQNLNHHLYKGGPGLTMPD